MADHPAVLIQPRPGIHAAECPCGWMGADWGDEEGARTDARLHREGKQRAWIVPPGTVLEMKPLGERPFEGV